MVVASKLCWSRLPDELERNVFTLACREPPELAKYIRVARRVRAWLESILYRKISLLTAPNAERLLYSLTSRSKIVLYLYIGPSVPPSITALILRRSPRLVCLVLHAGGNSWCKFNAILPSLNNLTYLRYLTIDPAFFPQTTFVHLPDMTIFHRVTHLDVTTQWDLNVIAIGFQYLHSLTHLSMTWKMSRTATHCLLALLQRPGFKMLLLWLDEVDGRPMVIQKLLRQNLHDPRIVLLRRASKWAIELRGGFWLHAAQIIAWRQENNITTVEHPTVLEDITTLYTQSLDYQSFPWERD